MTIYGHGGSGACTAASQQEGHGFDSRMLALRGRSRPPQTFSAQVGYLPGLSVWSLLVLPVFTRGFLHYEPQQTKHAEEQNTLLSIPDQDGRFTWSPGAYKLPTAPGRSWRKDGPGWEKGRE